MQTFPFRRVTVTGGAGFLGRRLVAKLRALGGVEVFVPRKCEYDLVDQGSIVRLLNDARPQAVIHLAAVVGGIGHNQRNPGRFLYENLMMGTQLIEQSRLFGVEKFVAIGTVCAYPKFTPTPFKESDLWNGYPEETNAPYGLAKKMMLAQLQAYRAQYAFKGIYLLPANLYGPEDSFDLETSHVIPALIRKCVTAKREGLPAIDVWGDGSPSREFLYVDDCAQGILQATSDYDGDEPVNLGTGQEIKIKDLVEMIVELTKFRGEIRWQTDKPNGQPRRRLDVSRAREAFGFEARTPLRDGLKTTIEWYEQSLGKAS
jgi:GDP-L-fucose synthase